ncbi:MAG: glycosyltransferase family 4 protein [Granulosicoccus sp.]
MLRAIGSHLIEQGHAVSVLTGEPSYKTSDRDNDVATSQAVDGISVRRLRLLPGSRSVNLLRLLSKALWPLRAMFLVLWEALCGRRQDVVVAATIPPVVNGLCGLLAARLTGARFVYHLQDIYPEIGSAGGLWSEKSLKHRVLFRMDSYICRHADRCIVLSQDMADALYCRGVLASQVNIINNFMLVTFDETQDNAAVHASLPESQGRFRVVFAGNLGRFQGLNVLLGAFLEQCEYSDELELHFLGEGAAMKSLRDTANGHKNVFFHGHKPFEQACLLMSECDAGIVSIQPDIYRFAYPSKTLTYLGLGLPVLALLEQESALAKEVVSLELGVSAINTDPAALKQGFADLVQYLNSDANNRERIKQVTDSLYSKNIAMSHWTLLVDDLAQIQASARTAT